MKVNQNTEVFIHKNVSKNIVCVMVANLSRGDELMPWLSKVIATILLLLFIGSSLSKSLLSWWKFFIKDFSLLKEKSVYFILLVRESAVSVVATAWLEWSQLRKKLFNGFHLLGVCPIGADDRYPYQIALVPYPECNTIIFIVIVQSYDKYQYQTLHISKQ